MSTTKAATIVRLLEFFREQGGKRASRRHRHSNPDLVSAFLVAVIGLLVTSCLILATPPVRDGSGMDFTSAMLSP